MNTITKEQAVKSVLIIGDTLDGWLSAAFLAQQFKGTKLQINICAHPQQKHALNSVVVSTPSLAKLHSALNLDERDVLKFCKGIFRLGTQFKNWHKGGSANYVHPYHDHAEALEGAAFHHHWLRLSQDGHTNPFDSYSLSARMGRAGKFRHPMSKDVKLRASFIYGYHLDRELYTQFMRNCALHYGVKVMTDIKSLQTQNDQITSCTLNDGQILEADLYLDCTGNGSALTQLNAENWQSWSEDTPFNAVAYANDADMPSRPLSHINTFSHGWVEARSLQSGGERICVYAKEGAEQLPALLGTHTFNTQEMNLGKFQNPWTGNCIAIGESACSADPLEAPELRFSEMGLLTLRDLFPVTTQDAGERAEYNRIMSQVFDRFHDFQIAHYKCVGHQGDIWDTCVNMNISDELACKIEQFKSRGRVVMYDHESFNAESWTALFLGQGLMPKRYDPLANTQPLATLDKNLLALHDMIEQAVTTAPKQLDYLDRAGVLTPKKAT